MPDEHFIAGKDASLEHSIATLQARLAAHGFAVEECSWRNPVAGVWSVHVRNPACHLMFANGKGASPIKARDASAIVLDADKGHQIAVLLNGQNNGAMPAWKQLSDTEIAAVITYTKNAWSNRTEQIVQPADIVAARK